MNGVYTVIGAVLAGGLAVAPALAFIWLSNNSDRKRVADIAGMLGGIYLWIVWIPLSLFLAVEFIGRLTNG